MAVGAGGGEEQARMERFTRGDEIVELLGLPDEALAPLGYRSILAQRKRELLEAELLCTQQAGADSGYMEHGRRHYSDDRAFAIERRDRAQHDYAELRVYGDMFEGTVPIPGTTLTYFADMYRIELRRELTQLPEFDQPTVRAQYQAE
jgi:hypothetical protein